ncbi:MAG: OPT/YSL family transporter [Verrucomicrobia bacterium]|nr:OPT/YSL family transporter [Verrucomicrobiota bacterium]
MDSDLIPKPFIPASASLREFTPRAVIVGTFLGMIFGASSLYLVLKVGLTVSASIPVAVISITLFRLWEKLGGRDATILEHNITQSAGSAGESLAFGVGVTMPAILILGFDLELFRVALVAVLGGLLGILMMIPLRRALIVQEHGKLKYPEGTACAEVLKAGACDESRAVAERGVHAASPPGGESTSKRPEGRAPEGLSARTIFAGFGLGLAYKTAMIALKGWKEVPEKIFGAPLKSGSVGVEVSPELLGVGYIIGPRIGCIMAAGGVLSYLLLIPLIKFFGEGLAAALPPGTVAISQMSAGQVRSAYILYIGAGAVTAGGLISLVRSLPTIWRGLKAGVADFSRGRSAGRPGPQQSRTESAPENFHAASDADPLRAGTARAPSLRTDRDLSMKFVALGIAVLIAAMLLARPLHINPLAAVLVVVFGFLFVTVSSRLCGEIGSSSNPISGMTIATLLLTCLIFLLVGWTGGDSYVTALSVGGIVCVAAANGGNTSQDLKTGFLVGATPRAQQVAILIGAAASALALGPILLGLNQSATVYVPAEKIAPGLIAPANEIGASEKLRGPQSATDANSYRVWHQADPAGGAAKKFLVDDSGRAVWFVDPGINGTQTRRPDGTEVRKLEAPKAVLVSYIIRGILDRKLPWSLVLFGVMIAVTLELAGVSSLAFAVGVYLPLATSAPIFIGGMIRWLVDHRERTNPRNAKLTEAELAAGSDKSPGVLMASGYIAGGAIAGIIIAIMASAFAKKDAALGKWAEAHNPFFAGPHADWLSLLPFVALCALLLFVARRRT